MNRFGWSRILSMYLFRHVLIHVLLTWIVLALVVNLIDTAELLRRSANKETMSSVTAMSMAFLKFPSSLPFLLPFAVMFGSLISFYKLSHKNEIIVARSAGLPVSKIILGPVLCAIMLSLVMLFVIDPISSATNNRFAALEEQNFGSSGRNLSVSTEGIWLKDNFSGQNIIISGSRLDQTTLTMEDGELYRFDKNNAWVSHYLPDQLWFENNRWQLKGGKVLLNDGTINTLDSMTFPSSLNAADLANSNKKPETISLIKLWSYIGVLEDAGLNSLGHRSYFYYQLSLPIVLIGMIMIAGHHGLTYKGRKKRLSIIMVAMISALGFYLFKDIMYVFGTSGRLPPIIAGLAPGCIVTLVGLGSLMKADQNA